MDLNFKLKDGSILHLEEETDISKEDLLRFASYDLKLYNRYRDRIRTVVLCVDGFEESEAGFNAGCINYGVTVIDMSEKDGDLKLKEIRKKIENDQPVNILDLIFLPLMSSEQEMVARVKQVIELEQQLKLSVVKSSKVVAMTLVMVDKFLSEREISEIWRDYKMLKIFKYAEKKGEEKGVEKGMEKGMEKGKKEGIEKIVYKQLMIKFGKLPEDYKEKLTKLGEEELELVAEKIMEISELKELDKYL